MLLPLIALLSLLLFSCGPKTPEEAVAQARAKYTVQLNTFQVVKPDVEETPMEALEGETMEDGAAAATSAEAAATEGEAAEGEAAEGEEAAAMEPEGPVSTEILLDLLLAFDGSDPLPGVTMEISHADPFEKEKGHYRRYLETGNARAGDSRQLSEYITVENFETGDVFSVSIRPNVPPEEQGEYREFAEYTP